MAAVLQPLRIAFLLFFLSAQRGQGTVEDISYLEYDMTAQGTGRQCLPDAIAYANRSNISFGPGLSYPVHIWAFWWPLGLVMAELVKILFQEVMGFHAVSIGYTPQGSISAWTALADCYNPGNPGLFCRTQAPGSRGHVAFETWANYDTQMITKFADEGLADRTPIRVGFPGGMGFDGIEGLFVSSASTEPAATASGNYLFLEYYKSYNDSWSSPQPYFTDYTNVSNDGRQACVDMGAYSMNGGLATYIQITGDNLPTFTTASGTEVAQCVNDWLPAKACRERNSVGCIPIVTCALSLPDILQWMFWFNMPTVLGSYTWGAYVSVTRDNRIIVLWWLPDNTFANNGYTEIVMPPVDKDAINQGSIRTQKPATKVWKMMSSLLPQAEPLLETFMINYEISMGSMMTLASNYDGSDAWQAACDFLTNYPERWSPWIPDRTACIAGQGLTTDANGMPTCAWCPFGTHSAPHPNISTSRICVDCDLGRFQPSPGQTMCQACLPGTASGLPGLSACETCPLGYYTNLTGSSACFSCGAQKVSPAFWTTMRELPTDTGIQVSYVSGASSASDCTCDAGLRYADDTQEQCVPCIEALTCNGMGHVSVLEGYAALNGDVNQVFECNLDRRWCPGGDPGVCAQGRLGIQCGECLPDHAPSNDGTCVRCDGAHLLPFIIVMVVAFLMLSIGYHTTACTKDGLGKQPLSIMLVITSCGQVIVLVQMTGVLSSLTVEWAEPFSTVLAISRIISSFNFDILNLSCIATMSPLSTYISRVCIVFIGIALLLVIFSIHTLVLRQAQFKKMGKKLLVTIGALSMALFISVLTTITAPLQCYEHPSGDFTVRSFPVVLCDDNWNSVWVKMVFIAAFGSLLPLGLLSLVIWIVVNFPKRMQMVDTEFFAVTGFLFVCYKVETYWFCLAIWLRNLTIALVPVLPSFMAQVVVYIAVVIAMLILVSKYEPWRASIGNFVDSSIYVMVNGVCALAIGFASPSTSILAPLCMALFCICALALVSVLFYGMLRLILPARKKYEYFISHHKAAAGAFARLLKMMILEAKPNNCEVFIDADNLTSLDLLFDTVGSDVENISLVASAEFMKRPWCIGELTIACIRKVKVWPMYLSDFQQPDEEFIENYLNQVPDIRTLAENNICLSSLQEAMRWFNKIPYVGIPAKLSNVILNELVQKLLTNSTGILSRTSFKSASVSSDVSKKTSSDVSSCSSNASTSHVKSEKSIVRKDSQLMVAADVFNFEAMNTARILCKLLLKHQRGISLAQQNTSLMPEVLADCCTEGAVQLAKSTTMLVCVLTNGSLTTLYMVQCLEAAYSVNAALMPVIGDDGFRFPSQNFYQDLRAYALPLLKDPDLADTMIFGVGNMFKRIAPLFESNASQGLLDAQSYEVYKKIRGFYEVPAGARKPDWQRPPGYKGPDAQSPMTPMNMGSEEASADELDAFPATLVFK